MYQYYLDKLTPWLKNLIATRQCGTLIGLPGSGKKGNLLSALASVNYPDFGIINIQLSDRPDLTEHALYLVSHIDFRRVDHIKLLNHLTLDRETLPSKPQLIFLCGTDPFLYQSTLNNQPAAKLLFSNPLYFPFADSKNTSLLIAENEQRFSTTLPPSLHSPIYRLSGGCPYLVKNLIKIYLEDHRLADITHPKLIPLLDHLFSTLDPVYYDFIKQPAIQQPASGSLLKLGLWDNRTILSRLIADYAPHYQPLLPLKIDLTSRSVFINSLDVTSKLQSKEIEILLALRQQGKLTREEIGQICFKNDDLFVYSDYSIDKLMSRLRQKLTAFGADSSVIKTQKKYGYSLK